MKVDPDDFAEQVNRLGRSRWLVGAGAIALAERGTRFARGGPLGSGELSVLYSEGTTLPRTAPTRMTDSNQGRGDRYPLI